jgi:phenylalanine-4-hydroxylase
MGNKEYCKVVYQNLADVSVPPYTPEEHGTWKLLIEKQIKLIESRACEEFSTGLEKVHFPIDRIPRLLDVSETLNQYHGWNILRVDGLVHPTDFFSLLSQRIFPSTDFIRKRSELMYTPAPDMFHDLFGHTPLLTHKDFADFFQNFGRVGVIAATKFPDPEHEVNKMLERIYWFTVEFGLIQTPSGLRAYGAGSCSSPEELTFCVSDQCRKHAFNIDAIAAREYDIWHLQEDVFVVETFKQLGQEFENWAKRNKVAVS